MPCPWFSGSQHCSHLFQAWKQKCGFTTMKQPSQYPLNNSYVQQGEMINIIPSCHLNSYTQLLFPRGRPIFIFKYHLFHVCLSFYPVTRLSVPPPPNPESTRTIRKSSSELLLVFSFCLLQHHRSPWNTGENTLLLQYVFVFYEDLKNMQAQSCILKDPFIFHS